MFSSVGIGCHFQNLRSLEFSTLMSISSYVVGSTKETGNIYQGLRSLPGRNTADNEWDPFLNQVSCGTQVVGNSRNFFQTIFNHDINLKNVETKWSILMIFVLKVKLGLSAKSKYCNHRDNIFSQKYYPRIVPHDRSHNFTLNIIFCHRRYGQMQIRHSGIKAWT